MKEMTRFFAVHNVIPGGRRSGFRSADSSAWQPALDVYETADGLVVVVELPGVKGDEIQVQVLENRLQISGVRAAAMPKESTSVHHMEIANGPFSRQIVLPEWADDRRIEAEHSEGYLYITIGRKDSV